MRGTSKTLFALGAAAITIAGVGVSPVDADPGNGDPLVLSCDTLGSLDAVIFSEGTPSPALIVDSNRVLVPYRLHIDGSFTPSEGGAPIPFSEGFTKPGPRHGRTDHCSFHDEFTYPAGTVVVDGDVWVSYSAGR